MTVHLFDPARPDGTNQSLELAISSDGTPDLGRLYDLPARCGMAVRVQKGQCLTIRNPKGFQVCDFWAFCADDPQEYTSMAHLHTQLQTIFPVVGDSLTSNLRRGLMQITRDTSPGVHDTIIACCDHARYQYLGCNGYHDNCADNLRQALMAIGVRAPAIPAPFNIWMNVPVTPKGGTSFAAPVSQAGDEIDLLAEVDVIAVMSACPQDMTPVNGEGTTPAGLTFWVTGSTD